jgi:hypothetical protein
LLLLKCSIYMAGNKSLLIEINRKFINPNPLVEISLVSGDG